MRSFDEHLVLFARYAEQVHALTPDAWKRLRARCATIDGRSLDSIIDRAKLSAASQAMISPPPAAPLVVQAICTAHRLFMGTLALSYEAITTLAPSTDTVSARQRTTGNPRTDRYIDAMNLIEVALHRPAAAQRAVAAAVHAAGGAVLRHDSLAPAKFAAVYQWVETEIPYRLVDPDDDLPAAGAR